MPEDKDSSKGQDGQDGGSQETLDWEARVAKLSAEDKASYEAHVKGLKNTVEATRVDNRTLKDAKESTQRAAEQATGELKVQLEALSKRLESAERENAFLAAAGVERVTNAHDLWVLAQADEAAFRRNGQPDWQHLRSSYSYLFESTTAPRGNAGAGTQGKPPGGPGMEALLRQAAGRG